MADKNITNAIYGQNMTKKQTEQKIKRHRWSWFRKNNGVDNQVIQNEADAEHRWLLAENQRLHEIQSKLK